MKASYFPKALLYREWREGRLVYLLAIGLTFLPGIYELLSYMSLPTKEPYRTMMLGNYWQSFYNDTMTFHGHTISALFFVVVWVTVPILRITPERSRGSLTMLLTTPVRRTDWFRIKFIYGLAALTLGSIVWYLILWLLHFQAPGGTWPVGRWGAAYRIFTEVGIHWIVYASLYAIASFIGLCVTNTIVAIVACLGVTMAPLWLSTVLHEVFPNTLSVIANSAIMNSMPFASSAVPQGSWIDLLQWVSPMTMEADTAGFTWQNDWLYLYLALIPIVYVLSMQYFQHMRAGQFQNLLTRRSLWYWALTGISLVVGSAIGGSVASSGSYMGPDYHPGRHAAVFTASFISASAIIWLAIWAFFFVYDMRRRPAAERQSRRSKGAKAW